MCVCRSFPRLETALDWLLQLYWIILPIVVSYHDRAFCCVLHPGCGERVMSAACRNLHYVVNGTPQSMAIVCLFHLQIVAYRMLVVTCSQVVCGHVQVFSMLCNMTNKKATDDTPPPSPVGQALLSHGPRRCCPKSDNVPVGYLIEKIHDVCLLQSQRPMTSESCERK